MDSLARRLAFICLLDILQLSPSVQQDACETRWLAREPITLPCRLVNKRDRVIWYRNGSMIKPNGKDFEFDETYEFDKNLIIKNSKMTGFYECKHFPKGDRSCYIVKKEMEKSSPPTSPAVNDQKDVAIYSTVDLWCNDTSNDVRWYMVHNGTDADIGIQGIKLQIRNVSKDCGTVFRCKLQDTVMCEWNLNILSASTPVTLPTTPSIPVSLFILWNGTQQSTVSVPRNENVTLSCFAKGYIKPITRMKWFSFKRKENNEYDKKQLVADLELTMERGYRAKLDTTDDLKILTISFIARKTTFRDYVCEATLSDEYLGQNITSSIVNVVKIK